MWQQVRPCERAEPQVTIHQQVFVIFLVSIQVSVNHHLIASLIEDVNHLHDTLYGRLAADGRSISPIILQIDNQRQVKSLTPNDRQQVIGLFLSRSVLAEEVISTHHESGVPGITIIAAESGILVGFSLAGFDNDKLVVVILDSFIVNHPIMLGDINASYRKTVTVHVHRVGQHIVPEAIST